MSLKRKYSCFFTTQEMITNSYVYLCNIPKKLFSLKLFMFREISIFSLLVIIHQSYKPLSRRKKSNTV